jgi:8-oxo-dGTP diphosphatase
MKRASKPRAKAAPTRARAGKLHCYEYPRPAVTVDLAVLARFGTELRVLMVRRRNEPYAGCWALPGGFLEIDEPIETAARRELCEETGFDWTGPVQPIGVFGDPGRDPRGRTISLAYAAVVRDPPAAVAGGDDAAEAAWRDPNDHSSLAFDHASILAAALDWLRGGVAEGSLALALLPAEFTLADVRALLEALGKAPLSAIAWLARMLRAGQITAVEPRAQRFRSVAG